MQALESVAKLVAILVEVAFPALCGRNDQQGLVVQDMRLLLPAGATGSLFDEWSVVKPRWSRYMERSSV